MEFTVQEGKLRFLQTRNGKRADACTERHGRRAHCCDKVLPCCNYPDRFNLSK
ncbi:MAG: hypothetical protein LBR34_09005 [Prevotella sp.]|nr:hypothetical protein [Prevotella sp.]